MFNIVTTLDYTTMLILTKTDIVSIITLFALSTEYPVELVKTSKTANEDWRILIVFKIMHSQKLLWNLDMWARINNRHNIFW